MKKKLPSVAPEKPPASPKYVGSGDKPVRVPSGTRKPDLRDNVIRKTRDGQVMKRIPVYVPGELADELTRRSVAERREKGSIVAEALERLFGGQRRQRHRK